MENDINNGPSGEMVGSNACPKCFAENSVVLVPGGWYACNACHDNFTPEFLADSRRGLDLKNIHDGVKNSIKAEHKRKSLIKTVLRWFWGVIRFIGLYFLFIIAINILFCLVWAFGLGVDGVSIWFGFYSENSFLEFLSVSSLIGVVIGYFHSLSVLTSGSAGVLEKPRKPIWDDDSPKIVGDKYISDYRYNDDLIAPSVNVDGTPMLNGVDTDGNVYGQTETFDHH